MPREVTEGKKIKWFWSALRCIKLDSEKTKRPLYVPI